MRHVVVANAMVRLFDLILRLYPREQRAEFAVEMRGVFLSVVESHPSNWRFVREYCGLFRGALVERCRRSLFPVTSLWAGMALAFALHLLAYWSFLPGKGKTLPRVVEELASRLFLFCLLAGICFGQQDSATLQLAHSIYTRAFTDLRNAKTLDDMKKLSSSLDSPDWISVDRFGRTILTRKDADRDLASLLNLPAESRGMAMDIIWAEQDSDRLMVLAWMMPHEVANVDANGSKHQVMAATLVRDLFQKTPTGWLRIRHDKLVPNSATIAIDGVPRIMPPMDEQHRVTAASSLP